MSRLLPDDDVVLAYRDQQSRFLDLVGSLPEEAAATLVPACPDWTVADLVAHVIGVPEDILAGRMDGAGSDPWTQAQVDRHRGETLAELVAAGAAAMAELDAVLPLIPAPSNSQLVMDHVTHEHDLRGAVGRRGAEDSLGVRVALGWHLDHAERRTAGLADDLLAAGVSDFELLRALTGRRSVGQLDALGLPVSAISGLLAGTPMTFPVTALEP